LAIHLYILPPLEDQEDQALKEKEIRVMEEKNKKQGMSVLEGSLQSGPMRYLRR